MCVYVLYVYSGVIRESGYNMQPNNWWFGKDVPFPREGEMFRLNIAQRPYEWVLDRGGNYYCIPLGMTFVRDLASFWGVYLQRDTHRGKSCWLRRGSRFKDSNTIGHSPLQTVFQDEFMLSILPAGPCQDEELLLGLCYSQLCNLAGEKTATRPFQQRKPKACSCHFMPKASRKYGTYACLYIHVEIRMCIMNMAYCNAYHPVATFWGSWVSQCSKVLQEVLFVDTRWDMMGSNQHTPKRRHFLSWMCRWLDYSSFWCIPCTIWTVRFCWFFVLIHCGFHCGFSVITYAYWKVGRRNHSQDDWKLSSKWYGKSLHTWTSKTRPLFDDDLCDGRSVHSPRGGHYMLFADGPGVFEPHEFEARSVHGAPIAGGACGSRRRKENRLWVVPSEGWYLFM